MPRSLLYALHHFYSSQYKTALLFRFYIVYIPNVAGNRHPCSRSAIHFNLQSE